MDKVKLPREVAEKIDYLRSSGWTNKQIVTNLYSSNDFSTTVLTGFCELNDFDTLLAALVNGYEVEQTSEDMVREQYNTPKGYLNRDKDTEADIYRKGIKFALDTLNIKIEGVNA